MKFTIDNREYEAWELSNEQIVRLMEKEPNGSERIALTEIMVGRFKSNLCAKAGETRDDVFARFFGNYVNRCPNDFKRAAKGMGREHRYLQNEMFKLCLEYIKVLAEHYENGCYDGRNEYAAETSKKIIDYFKEIDYPY